MRAPERAQTTTTRTAYLMPDEELGETNRDRQGNRDVPTKSGKVWK